MIGSFNSLLMTSRNLICWFVGLVEISICVKMVILRIELWYQQWDSLVYTDHHIFILCRRTFTMQCPVGNLLKYQFVCAIDDTVSFAEYLGKNSLEWLQPGLVFIYLRVKSQKTLRCVLKLLGPSFKISRSYAQLATSQ